MLQRVKRVITYLMWAVVWIVPSAQVAAQSETTISLTSGKIIWTFDTHSGLSLMRLQYRSGKQTQTIINHPKGRPLFDLAVNATLPADAKMNDKGGYDWQPGPGLIDPASIEVVKARSLKLDGKNAIEFVLKATTDVGDIRAVIRVVAQGQGEVIFFTEIKNESSKSYIKTTLRGPILEEINIGDDPWYFFPRGRGILNNRPSYYASYYGQYAWMQCMGSIGQDNGLVLSMVPYEHEAQPKIFITQKAGVERIEDNSYNTPLHKDLLNSKGITQTIVWFNWIIAPKKTASYGPVAIRIRTNGSWRDIYGHYQEYLKTWWQPKRRQWIRHVYAHAAHHPYFADTLSGHIEYPQPVNDMVETILAKPMSLSSYLDYSLISPNNPEGIRRVAEGWRNRGIRMTAYVHAKAVSPEDDFAQKHAREFGLATPQLGEKDGGPPGVGADGLHWINLNIPEWRQWLGRVSTDILMKTKVDGIRLDCIGFTMASGANGSNPNVFTPPTRHGNQVKPSVDTVAYIRSAMNKVKPEAVLGAENLGTDLMMNIMDYSLCYNIWGGYWVDKDIFPSPVSYIRFIFPDFKFVEITAEPSREGIPFDSDKIIANGRFTRDIYLESLNQILFNGCGWHGWNSVKEYIPWYQTMHRVLTENTHCFEGKHLIPEIPTLKEGIYANWFASSAKRGAPRVITLMNWTREPVDGPLVEVELSDGQRIVELVNLKEVDVEGNKVSLPISPMRAAVLRVVPGKIMTEKKGDSVIAQWPTALRKDQKIIAYIIKPNGEIIDGDIKMTGNKSAVVMGIGSNDRVVIQVMNLFKRNILQNPYVLDDMAVVE